MKTPRIPVPEAQTPSPRLASRGPKGLRRHSRDAGATFLSLEEFDQFTEDYDSFPRRVVKEGPTRYQDRELGLQEAVFQLLKPFAEHKQDTGLRGLAISAHEKDGQSWAATAVERQIARTSSGLKLITVKGESRLGAIPAVADIIGIKRFARLAHKARVTRSFRVLGPWTTGALLSFAVVLSAAVNLLGRLLNKPGQAPLGYGLLLKPTFAGPALLLGLLGILTQRTAASRKVDLGSAALSQLVSDIDSAPESHRGKFIDALASAFSTTHHPRAVVIDAFDRMDRFSQAVILRYLTTYSRPDHVFEAWVILESAPTTTFTDVLDTRMPADYFVQRFTQVRLVLPNAEERRRLAELRGHPERQDLTTFGAISRGSDEHSPSLLEFFAEHRKGFPHQNGSYSHLEFFYLLSLTTGWGGAVSLSESRIETAFAKPQLVRSEILQTFLEGTNLRRSEFHEALLGMREAFQRYVAIETHGLMRTVTVAPEVGRFLVANRGILDLPDPALGHLFWALFWHDQLRDQPTQPFEVRKLATHVLQTRSIGQATRHLSPRTAQSLFEASLDAARECLRYCMPEHVPSLLDCAQALVEPCGATSRGARLNRLITLCWQSFAVLGDEEILRVVVA